MSRANSLERKPLPPVPQTSTLSAAESNQTSTTDQFAQTLRKMSEDIPTTEYRSPLNIAGRIKNELADLTRENSAARSSGRSHRTKDQSRQAPIVARETSADRQAPDEGESITSAEKIRRSWEERRQSPDHRITQRHQSFKYTKDDPRYRGTVPPPTAFRTGDGFPWDTRSQEHDRPRHPADTHLQHRRGRSIEEPLQGAGTYEQSDDSEPQTPVLEIHNATPIHERDGMKAGGRPGLTSRFRESLQRIGVGSTRPAKRRTDISRSPSSGRGSRSPSPNTWRKPSPHSSIRATDQYATPHATRFPDALPRIESQRMELDWDGPLNDGQRSPRPPDDTIPTIPDLNTPGVRREYGTRDVPVIDGNKLRSTAMHGQPPVHHMENSDATATTAVNPPSQREYYQDDDLVLHNVRGPHDVYEGRDIVPGRLKRLWSLNGRNVPIDGPDAPPPSSPTSAARPKAHSTPSGIIRSASLMRTRTRRKQNTKPQEPRVEPVHVDYDSDGWGESPPVIRDAQGRIIPAPTKRRGSLKNKSTGPTKIALPMGQVEEFHSVRSNSPTEVGPREAVSSAPMLRSDHKRTTSTTTFHTAQSENTRPETPARKLSTSSTRQDKMGASESRHDAWRRSRAGAPRRPSQTLLTTTTGITGNQYADEETAIIDPRGAPDRVQGRHPYHANAPGAEDYFPPQPAPHVIPTAMHRSQSPAPPSQPIHVAPSPSPSPSPPPVPSRSPPPQEVRAHSPPVSELRARSPPPLLEPGQVYTPLPQQPHTSPEPSIPAQVFRAQSPPLEDRLDHTLPANNPPTGHLEKRVYDVPLYQPQVETQVEPGVRSPALDTPSYVLPRVPTPTLTSPGVLLNRPSPAPSPVFDRTVSPGPHTPPRSVHIEDGDEDQNLTSNERPLPRVVTELSEPEQRRRSQNRKTTSEMSFIAIEPLTKREKLAASMFNVSAMPWLRARVSSRSQPHTESSYYSTRDDEDPRRFDRRDRHERHRQPTDYFASSTVPQLPPMSHSPPPRPEVGKLPSWYPREQAARAAHSPLARDSRGPRIGQEAWGWRSSPDPHRFGIPEEPEELPHGATMPPWPYAGGVVTPVPDATSGVVRDESMMTPPVLPPRPTIRTSEPSGEKKRRPKYRIEQDSRGFPMLVPEPGFDNLDDNRWTVFEIGGVEFRRAPGRGGEEHGAQWIPKRLSQRRPDSHLGPSAHQYSDSPAPLQTTLE